MIKPASIKRLIIDTTVMKKATAHSADSRLPERAREHLVRAVEECGLTLRQNDNWEAPTLVLQVGRYALARQFKRIKAVLRTLRVCVGSVHRDMARQMD
jgi:transposase, IS5 family